MEQPATSSTHPLELAIIKAYKIIKKNEDLVRESLSAFFEVHAAIKQLNSAMNSDIDLQKVSLRDVDLPDSLKKEVEKDPYVDLPEEFDEETDVMAAYQIYRRWLRSFNYNPIVSISDNAYLMLQEIRELIRTKFRNYYFYVPYDSPSCAIHDKEEGVKYLLKEELRHYLNTIHVTGQEWWLYHLMNDPCIERMKHLLGEQLFSALDLRLEWVGGVAKGACITGSLIGACTKFSHYHGAHQVNKHLAYLKLLYPARYTKLVAGDADRLIELVRDPEQPFIFAGDTLTFPNCSENNQFKFEISTGVDVDLQICCDKSDFDDACQKQFLRVLAVFPDAKMTKEMKPNTYHWVITGTPRVIQMYWVDTPARVIQHHLAPARGFFYQLDGEYRFTLMPSCYFARSGQCKDMRYVMSKHNPEEIVAKYMLRGYKMNFGTVFQNTLEEQLIIANLPNTAEGIIGVSYYYDASLIAEERLAFLVSP